MTTPSYSVLTDDEFNEKYSMNDTVVAIEDAFKSHNEGSLIAPSRFSVDVPDGSLVFTVGAETNRFNKMGFRVYETIPESPDDHQLVAVFDSVTGDFLGLIIGNRVGAVRTGAIGGVAVNHLSNRNSSTLGILGSGRQAKTQLEAALTVQEFEQIKVFSPTKVNREAFAEQCSNMSEADIEAVESTEEAARGVDVLITATTSREPIFDVEWIEPGMHINTVGPKFKEIHELDPEIESKVDVIITDSIAQIEKYTQSDLGFFLEESYRSGDFIELSEVIAGDHSIDFENQTTLFCSAGLAGTEVIVAAEVLR